MTDPLIQRILVYKKGHSMIFYCYSKPLIYAILDTSFHMHYSNQEDLHIGPSFEREES